MPLHTHTLSSGEEVTVERADTGAPTTEPPSTQPEFLVYVTGTPFGAFARCYPDHVDVSEFGDEDGNPMPDGERVHGEVTGWLTKVLCPDCGADSSASS